MAERYTDTPYNFTEIVPYIITDVSIVGRKIILAKKCYFYDTCSFRNHMRISDAGLIFKYIKDTGGIVVLTRTVLMELCSGDGRLWEEHVEYIRNLYLAGITVLVIYEEDLFEVLHTYCSDAVLINQWLSYAVKNAKSKVGSIEQAIGQDLKLKKALLESRECKDSKLAERVFQAARRKKEPEDNLGEEMLAICVHWLSHMRESAAYKYIIFSDDKKAMGTFAKVIRNAREYLGQDMISVFTTPKLCYQMKVHGVLEVKEQVINILSSGNTGDMIKTFCSEEFELSPAEKIMSIDMFAEKVITENVKIYY